MSDSGHDKHIRIPDDTQANYRRLRVERGMSWPELAAQFERGGHSELAAWARDEANQARPPQPQRDTLDRRARRTA